MDTLWANVSQFTPIPGIVPITPDFSNFNLPDRGTRVEFNMGDVVLHNIDNTEQFVNACQENLNLPCGKNYRDIKFIGECLFIRHSPILYGG